VGHLLVYQGVNVFAGNRNLEATGSSQRHKEDEAIFFIS
jgi:hypothetical protein